MAKKLVIVMMALLMLVPASIFAIDLIGLRVGPAALLNTTLDLEAENMGIDPEMLKDPSSYTFGADIRMNLSVIEVNALALVTPPGIDEELALDVYANAGLSLSLFDILRLGVSAGPNFTVNIGETVETDGLEPDPMEWGLNLRATADLELGDFSIGISGLMATGYSLTQLAELEDPMMIFTNPEIKAGVSAMFAIF